MTDITVTQHVKRKRAVRPQKTQHVVPDDDLRGVTSWRLRDMVATNCPLIRDVMTSVNDVTAHGWSVATFLFYYTMIDYSPFTRRKRAWAGGSKMPRAHLVAGCPMCNGLGSIMCELCRVLETLDFTLREHGGVDTLQNPAVLNSLREMVYKAYAYSKRVQNRRNRDLTNAAKEDGDDLLVIQPDGEEEDGLVVPFMMAKVVGVVDPPMSATALAHQAFVRQQHAEAQRQMMPHIIQAQRIAELTAIAQKMVREKQAAAPAVVAVVEPTVDIGTLIEQRAPLPQTEPEALITKKPSSSSSCDDSGSSSYKKLRTEEADGKSNRSLASHRMTDDAVPEGASAATAAIIRARNATDHKKYSSVKIEDVVRTNNQVTLEEAREAAKTLVAKEVDDFIRRPTFISVREFHDIKGSSSEDIRRIWVAMSNELDLTKLQQHLCEMKLTNVTHSQQEHYNRVLLALAMWRVHELWPTKHKLDAKATLGKLLDMGLSSVGKMLQLAKLATMCPRILYRLMTGYNWWNFISPQLGQIIKCAQQYQRDDPHAFHRVWVQTTH